MKQDGTLGAKQGAVITIIGSTEIEHVKLPGGKTNITSGDYSTFVEGKLNEQIELVVNSDQIGMQASGVANDLIKLAQTSVNWGSDVQALHTGNANKGATSKRISDLTKYLKHDISIDAADGNDKLLGTTGNDAIFLHNLVTKGDLGWLKNKTGLQSGKLGVSAISKGLLQLKYPFFSLAPIILTSSAFLSPDP